MTGPPRGTPRVRRAPIPEDAVLVVRGDDLDPRTAETQASDFRRRFPGWDRYRLSGYYARNDREVDDLAADQLERFPVLDVFGIADLEAHGFEIVATFRTPHVTILLDGDPSPRLASLATLARRSIPNPYHGSEPSEPPIR